MASCPTILLTGASGFVGRHVAVALEAAGYHVRCATRSVDDERAKHPNHDWVFADLERAESLVSALAGCDGAVYLVHGMGTGRDDYPERERIAAETFAAAASTARLRRIVYLGGVVPAHGASKHLASRRRTGEILRAGSVDTIELRAAMVIGAGSASWDMVRDLARRLPAMLLPRWLSNHSYPIAIEDVVVGVVEALRLDSTGSHVYELPGPERVTHREVLERAAAVMGRKSFMVGVPVLTPRLSSYWIALVTRTSLPMAKELVEGVRFDLDPDGDSLWDHVAHKPMPLVDAIHRAIFDDDAVEVPSSVLRRRLEEVGFEHRVAAVA